MRLLESLNRVHGTVIRELLPWRALIVGVGIVVVGTTILPRQAWAVRPFVTDDGEIVPHQQLEMETWIQVGAQSFEHNLNLAVGVLPWLELSLGAVYGVEHRAWGVEGPSFGAKVSLGALEPDDWTGALAVGGVAPLGNGAYARHGGVGFLSLAFSKDFGGEKVLLHVNAGVAFEDEADGRLWSPTAAIATQFHLASIVHGAAEIFYADPMDPDFDFGAQIGVRFVFSDYAQLDVAFGSELTHGGDFHPWGTLGFRFVSRPPASKRARTDAEQDRLASAWTAEDEGDVQDMNGTQDPLREDGSDAVP